MIAITIAVCATRADRPLPPPAKVSVMSPSGRFRAVSEPKAGTRLEACEATQSALVLPDWHRSLFVADDGKHLVTQYDGLNLLPTKFMMIRCCSRSGAKEKSFAM